MFARLKPRRRKGKRRYIDPRLGVAGFFAGLNRDIINYTALRWFETLPDLAPGEDIDILVSDEHLARIEPYLTGSRRSGIPVDLYTVAGLPGTDFRGVPYFPPPLARKVLATAIMHPNGVRAPDPWHHLATMAYHALFHKGFNSGLPERAGVAPRTANPEHDYATVICSLARAAGITLEDVSLQGLHAWLGGGGWAPPADTIEKLAQKNEWLRETALAAAAPADPLWEGLAVFIVRARGRDHLPLIREVLWGEGFDVLDEGPIPASRLEQASLEIRGGNWHAGPWPQTGGLPVHVIVAFDLFPVEPGAALRAKHFGLANERVHRAKLRVRDSVNRILPPERHCNVLHSSDNARQALHYLDVALDDPGREAALAGRIALLRKQVDTGFEIVRPLSRHGRRAAVWLIRFAGGLAVCKIFRPGRERYMERELLAREIGTCLPEVLPVLAKGERWIVLPYLEDLDTGRRFFRRGEMAAIRRLIRHFRAAGYELIDFKPGNVLISRGQGLKVIDFEFMQRAAPSKSLEGAYCWYRVPETAGLDLPAAARGRKLNYYRFWVRRTGLPLSMALRDLPGVFTRPVQAAFGAFFWIEGCLRKPGRR